MTVEGINNDVCKLLDATCGIDYLNVYDKNNRVLGIANRIQWIKPPYPPYNTFTIRKGRESGADTEFKKRVAQIKEGGLYPELTMHTYVESGTDKILSLAIARTKDVIDYILKFNPPIRLSKDEHGTAWFYCCDWNDMIDKNYYLLKCEVGRGKNHNILLASRPQKGA